MCEGYVVRYIVKKKMTKSASDRGRSHSRSQKTPATVVIDPINVFYCGKIV